jgi:hypothetical protein
MNQCRPGVQGACRQRYRLLAEPPLARIAAMAGLPSASSAARHPVSAPETSPRHAQDRRPRRRSGRGLRACTDRSRLERARGRHRSTPPSAGSDGRQALGPLGKAQRQRRKHCFSDRRGIFREALVGATSISPRMRSRRTVAPRVFARCSELSVRNSAKSSDPFPPLNGGFGLFINLIHRQPGFTASLMGLAPYGEPLRTYRCRGPANRLNEAPKHP